MKWCLANIDKHLPTHTHTNIHTHKHTHNTHTQTHVREHRHTRTHSHTQSHKHTHTHTQTHTCTLVLKNILLIPDSDLMLCRVFVAKFYILSASSGKVLNVNKNNLVSQYSRNGQSNQYWYFMADGSIRSSFNDKALQFQGCKNNGLFTCLI